MNNLHKEVKKCKCKDRRCEKDRRVADSGIFAGADRRGYKDRRTGLKRRKHQRFQIGAFIFVQLKTESAKDVGQLIDISNGGLSFRYLLSPKKPAIFSALDIVLSGSDFAITDLPFRTISDNELADEFQSGPIIFRRHSVQFEQLTYNQHFKLYYFLYNHRMDRPI